VAMSLEPTPDIDPWIVRQEPESQAWIVSSSRQTHINDDLEAFENALHKGLNQKGSWLVLDLSLATLTGSATMRIIVSSARDAKNRGKEFLLVFPRGGIVDEIFRMAGIPGLFTCFYTLEEALQYIKEQSLRKTIIETQAEASLGGHDLGPFEPSERGYQAECRKCGGKVWVRESGAVHSLLEERCADYLLNQHGPWILKYEEENKAWIVSASRRIYLLGHNSVPFKELLREGLGQKGSWLIADLTMVTNMDGYAFRILVRSLGDAIKQGRGFLVVIPHDGRLYETIQKWDFIKVLLPFHTLNDSIQHIDKREPHEVVHERLVEASAAAAATGHDLGPFEPVGRVYQAECRKCRETVWIAENGVMYSLMGERCKGG
jgi:anti-anti-sigma regulatory factor